MNITHLLHLLRQANGKVGLEPRTNVKYPTSHSPSIPATTRRHGLIIK